MFNGILYIKAKSIKKAALIFFLLVTSLSENGAITSATVQMNLNWYNTSWMYRKLITIDHRKVAATLINYPLLINIPSDSDLAFHAQANGNDILFTNSDGTTKLNHEIEKYTSGTGNLQAWVQIPLLSSTKDTTIYMYYGNDSATNQQNIAGTWDGNYMAVWHLNKVSNSQKDSTSHANNLNTISLTKQGSISGQINGADKFNGSTNYLATPHSSSLTLSHSLTLEAWINPAQTATTKGNSQTIMRNAHSISPWQSFILNYSVPGNNLCFSWFNTARKEFDYCGSTTLSINTWYHVVATYDGSTIHIYVNGVEDTAYGSSIPTGNILQSDSQFMISQNNKAYAFNGTINEVRVSNIARSAAWVQTEYDNQYSPATFYTISSEVSKSSGTTATQTSSSFSPSISRNLKPFLGAALGIVGLNDPGTINILKKYGFHILTPENELNMNLTQPTATTFDFGKAEPIIAFAKANGMTLVGHILLWNQEVPAWVISSGYTPDQLASIAQNRIRTLLQHYPGGQLPGQFYSWDVVNEALDDNQPLNTTVGSEYVLRPYNTTCGTTPCTNIWSKINQSSAVKSGGYADYVIWAFAQARAADPNHTTKLYYNDYNIEPWSSPKAKAAYNLVKTLHDKGLIDGVGLQTHIATDQISNVSSYAQDVETTIQHYQALGVDVAISEMDVKLTDARLTQKQADLYKAIATICAKYTACKRFTTWGVTDKFTWIGRSSAPLLFSATYEPKIPAWNDVQTSLGYHNVP